MRLIVFVLGFVVLPGQVRAESKFLRAVEKALEKGQSGTIFDLPTHDGVRDANIIRTPGQTFVEVTHKDQLGVTLFAVKSNSVIGQATTRCRRGEALHNAFGRAMDQLTNTTKSQPRIKYIPGESRLRWLVRTAGAAFLDAGLTLGFTRIYNVAPKKTRQFEVRTASRGCVVMTAHDDGKGLSGWLVTDVSTKAPRVSNCVVDRQRRDPGYRVDRILRKLSVQNQRRKP